MVQQLLHLQRQGLARPQAAGLSEPALTDGGGAGRGWAVGARLHGGRAGGARRGPGTAGRAEPQHNGTSSARRPRRNLTRSGAGPTEEGAEPLPSNGGVGRLAASPGAYWPPELQLAVIGWTALSVSGSRVVRPAAGPRGAEGAPAGGFRGGPRRRRGSRAGGHPWTLFGFSVSSLGAHGLLFTCEDCRAIWLLRSGL